MAKLNIAYSKVAKQYDMELLKSTMWQLLTKPEDEEKVCDGHLSANGTLPIKVGDQKHFCHKMSQFCHLQTTHKYHASFSSKILSA